MISLTNNIPGSDIGGIKLSKEQENGLKAIENWFYDFSSPQEFYLAGYAGTGKTTIARYAIQRLKEKKKQGKILKKVLFAAFTGKAADVLRRKTGFKTQTIHTLIYIVDKSEDGQPSFVLNHKSELKDADLLVLDECSMISEELANDLKSFGVKILVLGDPGQLSPVNGISPFLSRQPDYFLHQIHRQAAENPIIQLSILAREGKPIPYQNFGEHIEKIRRNANAMDAVANNDGQIICGIHKIRWSTTRWLRSLKGFEEEVPQPGEPLICCRNNSKLNIFNGTSCTLQSVNKKTINGSINIDIITEENRELLKVKARQELFWEHYKGNIPKTADFFKKDINHFDWSYVISCHKSQGSSWPGIVVIDDSHCFGKERNQWLYTAITRAEEKLLLVSNNK